MARGTLDAVLRHARRLTAALAERQLTDGELLERFVHQHEETAFALLLERHGPMVLAVCRRLLHHDQDAEDAFQATFLVLARKAHSIRKRDSVGSWLYGVAQRIAVRAKTQLRTRQAHERRAVPRPLPQMDANLQWHELLSVLDEELARLPEKYRAPVVLCFLEGKTHEQAARELGWAKSSLTTRLGRARELLQERLAWRGLTLSAGLLVPQAAPAAVPDLLMLAMVRAATTALRGEALVAGVVSPQVLGLAQGTLRALSISTWSITAALVLAAGVVLGAGLLASQKDVAGREERTEGEPLLTRPLDQASTMLNPVDAHGDPLPPGAIARLGTIRFRHGGKVHSLAFSPDGAVLVSGSQDRNVRLWDAATGNQLRVMHRHQSPVLAVALSPDGKILASAAAQEDVVRLWDVTSGEDLGQLRSQPGQVQPNAFIPAGPLAVRQPTVESHGSPIQSFAFAPNGRTLAAASADGTLHLWDVATGKECNRWFARHGPKPGDQVGTTQVYLQHVAFSPNGRVLAACGSDGAVSLWDPATAQELHRLTVDAGASPAIAFAPQGNVLAVGGRRLLVLWDVALARELRRLELPSGSIQSVAFAPDAKTLAFGTDDHRVCLVETATGKLRGRFAGHQGPVGTVAFSPDGNIIASGGDDHTIRLWDVTQGKELLSFSGHQGMVTSTDFSPDGRLLASAGQDEVVRLWDVATAREERQLRGHHGVVRAVAFCLNGQTIATAGEDRVVRLWDAVTGQEVRQLHGHQDRIVHVAASPSGMLLVTGSVDRTIRVWEAATGKELRRFGGDTGQLIRVVFTPDGKTVVSTSADNTVRLWEVATGKELCRIGANHGWPLSVACSPDGQMLATGRDDGLIRLWDVRSGGLLCELRADQNWVSAVAFSPDGRTLASASYTGAIRLWEVETGRECFSSPGHRGAAWSLCFSPNGRLLASSSSDTTVLLTDVSGLVPKK
jgi:RNA polymerase sigma factor (sigma-70 family)